MLNPPHPTLQAENSSVDNHLFDLAEGVNAVQFLTIGFGAFEASRGSMTKFPKERHKPLAKQNMAMEGKA